MTPNTAEVVKAALAIFGDLQAHDLHQLARGVPNYSLRAHDEDFVNDVPQWQSAIENADGRALRLIVLLAAQHGDGTGTKALGSAILRASELYAEEALMLEVLRDLILFKDPGLFRTLLPLLVRSWDGGWVSFERSAPANRAELVAEFFETNVPMTITEPHDWPSLESETGTPDHDIPDDVDKKDYEWWTSMIRDVFPRAVPETQQRLIGILRAGYQRANSVAARYMAGRALIDVGVLDHLLELTESRFASLRRLGFWKALEAFETARLVVGRYAHLLLRAEAELGEPDRQRQRSLREALKSANKIAVALNDGRLSVCWREETECLFFDYDPTAQSWGETTTFAPDLDRDRSIIGLRIEFPPSARGRYFKFAMTDNGGRGVTYYLHYDGAKNLVAARTVAEKKAQLGGKQGSDQWGRKPAPSAAVPSAAAPSAPVAEPEQKPALPKPAPPVGKNVKKRTSDPPFEIRAAPKDPRLLLPENERLAVYSAETKELLLDPPTSVAIVVTEQHFISWCAVGHRGRAGGRGASLWAVELYARETSQLVARHEIQNQRVISWCWPVRLRCARTHHYRLIVLSCRSEDFTQEIYVVRLSDTTFIETLDRAEALAALRR